LFNVLLKYSWLCFVVFLVIIRNCSDSWVANTLDFNKDYEASVFETTIRLLYKVYFAVEVPSSSTKLYFLTQCYTTNIFLILFFVGLFPPKSRVVGGLLSAYDLSGDKVFLDKAREIADRLLPAWNTPTGIPYNIINLSHGRAHNPSWTGVNFRILFMHFSLTAHQEIWNTTSMDCSP